MALNQIINKTGNNVRSWSNITVNSVATPLVSADVIVINSDITLPPDMSLNATQLQGRDISSDAPADNNVLKWSTGNNRWEPAADSVDTNATQLQGRDVASDAPADFNILTWSSDNNNWEPSSNVRVDSVLTSDIDSHTIKTHSLEVDGTYFISEKADFDKLGYVSDNVVYLHDGESYCFTKIVDIGPYRIECGDNNTICGIGVESTGLRSTGLSSSDYIVSSNSTLTVKDMSFFADPVIDQNAIKVVSSDGDSNTLWKSLIFSGFGSNTGENTLLFDNCQYVLLNTVALISSSNIVFKNTSGNFSTISLTDCELIPKTGGNVIVFEDTFGINQSFRTAYTTFFSLGDSAMVISSDATFPTAGHILDTVSFKGVSGPNPTISGMDSFSPEAMWNMNNGIVNTAEIGEMIFQGNTSDTIISNTTDFVSIAGEGIPGQFNQRFTVSDADINYTGALSFPGKALASGSLSSGRNNEIDIAVSRNGVISSDSIQTTTTDSGGKLLAFSTFYVGLVEPSDVFSIAVRNNTTTSDVLIDKLHVLVNKI